MRAQTSFWSAPGSVRFLTNRELILGAFIIVLVDLGYIIYGGR